MKTGLFDKNGRQIKIGDKVRLILDNGEERVFDVQFRTVQRTVKCHPEFDDEFAKVNITGVVFCWNGFELFPCVDENGVSDTAKMEVIREKRKAWIFQVDEYSWYAAHSIMEFLNWYHRNIDSIEIPDELSEMTMIEPENGMMWSNQNITQEDIEALGELDELSRGGIGDLKRVQGEIFKYVTFADVLGDEDFDEPFEIASTEW